MRLAAVAVLSAFVVGGCASRLSTGDSSNTVRTRAPVNYENTITNYFDFNVVDDPAQRKLVFAAPEASRCALFGGGGAHQGYVVPVIYDTTLRARPVLAQPVTPTVQAQTAAAVAPAGAKNVKGGKNAKKPTGAAAAASAPAIATSGTGAEPAPVIAPAMTLKDVSITGNRYFFWFSNETISAVTRRMDLCP
jgi:hypothetical protein